VSIVLKKILAQASILLENMVRCVKRTQHPEKKLDCYYNLVILLRSNRTQSLKSMDLDVIAKFTCIVRYAFFSSEGNLPTAWLMVLKLREQKFVHLHY
jgi:hypothetical protein